MKSVADIWDNVLLQLKKELSETSIKTWFDDLEPVDIKGTTFLLYCPNSFKIDYIKSYFLKNIKDALREIFSMDFEVQILDDDELQVVRSSDAKKSTDRFTADEFTFATFVVGETNKMAYAASMAVSEHPGQNYNPLLIYGDSGLGKTHLLHAIANKIRKDSPTSKIVYVKGDDFINEFISLIRAGRGSEFRAKYREADLLLVDDVQFVAGKDQVQNEFFHTFNNLYESGRQIVMTSDRPPSEMTLLDDRLRTRFTQGLPVDVKPPDFETRVAIVKNKSSILGMELSDKIAAMIAQRVTANVRQLEGTINKVLAYKELMGDDINEDTVCMAIDSIVTHDNEFIPSCDVILEYISKYYNVEIDVLKGQQRGKTIVNARQIAMYLIRNMINMSTVDIGKVFGNRDHTTVLYSLEQVEKKMATDAAFAETVKQIKTNINSR